MSEIAYPVVTSDWFVDHAGGRTLAECVGGSDDDCIANARRIAACLNACRDISTEDLERCNGRDPSVWLAVTEYQDN